MVINYDHLFDIMLSGIERERLEHRENVAPDDRKVNEYGIRQKTKKWLADAEDVKFVLDKLPEKQLNKIISNGNLAMQMDLLMEMLYVLGPIPIIQGEYAPSGSLVLAHKLREDSKMLTRPSLRRGYREVIRRAERQEIERAELVVNFIKRLLDTLSDEHAADILEDIVEMRPEIEQK